MTIDKAKKGLVRGVVTIEDRYDNEVTAYTFWYRYDEPDVERKVTEDTDRLLRTYQHMNTGWSSATIGTEWKPFRDKDTLYY